MGGGGGGRGLGRAKASARCPGWKVEKKHLKPFYMLRKKQISDIGQP